MSLKLGISPNKPKRLILTQKIYVGKPRKRQTNIIQIALTAFLYQGRRERSFFLIFCEVLPEEFARAIDNRYGKEWLIFARDQIKNQRLVCILFVVNRYNNTAALFASIGIVLGSAVSFTVCPPELRGPKPSIAIST